MRMSINLSSDSDNEQESQPNQHDSSSRHIFQENIDFVKFA